MARAKAEYELRAEDKSAAAFRSFTGHARRAGRAVAGLGIMGAGAAVGGLAAVVQSSINAGDEVQKLSIQTGNSTEFLSEYQHVAQLTGANFNKLTKGLKTSAAAIFEFSRGGVAATEVFEELGFTYDDLSKLSPDEQFEAIGKSLHGVENETRRLALASKIYGGAAADVLRIWGNGPAAIKAMREESQRLGLSLSRDQVDKMAAANDAITRLQAAFKGAGNALAVEFAEPIAEAAESLTGVLVPALRTVGDWISNVGELLGGFMAVGESLLRGEFAGAVGAADALIDSVFGDDRASVDRAAGAAGGKKGAPTEVQSGEFKAMNQNLVKLIDVTERNKPAVVG